MEIDFISTLHKSTKRDYLSRVNDKEYPKYLAARLAKKWGYHYWDGSRKINYGGYKYIKDRWINVIKKMAKFYNLKNNAKILDVGCGKGFFLHDLKNFNSSFDVYGVDISKYAIKKSHPSIKNKIKYSSATKLKWPDNYFDLVISLNTLHNLHNYDLHKSLEEIERVGKKKYVVVESYRNEKEKMNLLYWQVTCEAFCTPEEWKWWFNNTGYSGDYSFIYFK
jgi:ubiquinone/menaquinone biosynthesis C-methylase UbiE